MYSFSTVSQQTASAGKILFWLVNGLGISFYNPQIPVRYKHLPAVYAVILLLWFSLHYPVGVYLTLNTFKFTLPMFAIYIQKFCENIAPVLLILRSLYESGSMMKERVGDLIYADQCLYLVGIQVWFRAIKRYLQISIILVSIYCAVLTGLYICATIKSLTGLFGFYSALTIALDNSSSTVYNIYLSYYFCSVMNIFKYRFQALNEEIRLMGMKKRVCNNSVIQVTPYKVKDAAKVKTIKFVHAIYREYAILHNKRFGPMILLQFFQNTVLTIINIYYVMNLIYQANSNKVTSQMSVGIISVICLVVAIVQSFFVMLGSTIVTCCRTSLEANDMENVVHELMNETDDKEILRELEDFSLELIHAKVVFTAFDCFTIDYSLFTKIIGAVASYVIIFLQFGNFDYQEVFNNVEMNRTMT